MGKLYFRYSAMNSGKTTALIQAAFNYDERGMQPVIIKPAIDTKGEAEVVSRLGTRRPVDVLLHCGDSVEAAMQQFPDCHCILVDEAQFLQPAQIDELFWYAINHNVPVMAYGLRTDFAMTAFPGASRLLALAHEIQELKTICRCGKKALLNGRKRAGQFIFTGSQVAIDGEDDIEYESLCGACYQRLKLTAA